MKRSVNFTGRKPMKAAHVASIVNWLGMSDAEVQVAFKGAAIYVNINGEDTVPAKLVGDRIHYTVGRRSFVASYDTNDIHPVSSDGYDWYEIDDTALTPADDAAQEGK